MFRADLWPLEASLGDGRGTGLISFPAGIMFRFLLRLKTGRRETDGGPLTWSLIPLAMVIRQEERGKETCQGTHTHTHTHKHTHTHTLTPHAHTPHTYTHTHPVHRTCNQGYTSPNIRHLS